MLRIQCLTIDSRDPHALAAFWSQALSWPLTDEGDNEVFIECPAEPGTVPYPDILFLRVDDAKSNKNRLHLDLRPDDQAAEVARLESLGATRIEIGQSAEPDATWVVMADPEGNEFCVLRAITPE
jgi:predicted enzyme related to lactoylglutathione lyase